MQAIAKEGGGGDHLSVKAKLPSGVEKAPLGGENIYTGIPGKFLGHLEVHKIVIAN